ncbi:hypothetical protein, partial [Rodentibacter pneumotropicus]
MKNLTTNKTLALALLAGLTASYSVAQVTDQRVQEINNKVEKNTMDISVLSAKMGNINKTLDLVNYDVGLLSNTIRELFTRTNDIDDTLASVQSTVNSHDKITQDHELRVRGNEFDIKTNKADIAQNKSD